MNIIFTDTIGIAKEYYPSPASQNIPEWYKKMESYTNNLKKPPKEGTSATIKKCMPIFDTIISGYIIYTHSDVYVSQVNNSPYYQWANNDAVKFHGVSQAPEHPERKNLKEGDLYPKWINPWSIETPKGYSTFFTQPMHRESVFTIFDGIVDTDKYNAPIHFPFVLKDWGFEGLIPAGTPMAQVIPFKRDSWEMQIGNQYNLEKQRNQSKYIRSVFFDAYKYKFRQKKEYK